MERLDAELREVSLVSFPAYAGAVVAGIRSTDFVLTEQARFQMLLERGIL